VITSRSLREEEAHEQQWNHPAKPRDKDQQPSRAPSFS
jgi:hypothetical protein